MGPYEPGKSLCMIMYDDSRNCQVYAQDGYSLIRTKFFLQA